MAADRPVAITISDLAPVGGQQGDVWIKQSTTEIYIHNGLSFQPPILPANPNIDGPIKQTIGGQVLTLTHAITQARTLTFPDVTSTLAALGLAQTWTALQSFGVNLGGTLQTAAQPNVTSLGTLTGLTVNGLVDISGASGGQVKFPSSQNASADVHTLDDYAEGTWTPSLGGSTTYNGQTGTYTKIGRLVMVHFDININAVGTGSTKVISGLPFTAAANPAYFGGSIAFFSSLATSVVYITPYVVGGGTTIQFGTLTAAATGDSDNGNNIFGNSTRIMGAVTYTV